MNPAILFRSNEDRVGTVGKAGAEDVSVDIFECDMISKKTKKGMYEAKENCDRNAALFSGNLTGKGVFHAHVTTVEVEVSSITNSSLSIINE